MFSVDTEQDAQDLLIATCPRNLFGEFLAPDLIEEQTLENLQRFSDRLQDRWNRIQAIRKKRKKAGKTNDAN